MFHFSFKGSSISFASVSNVMLSLLEPDRPRIIKGLEVGADFFQYYNYSEIIWFLFSQFWIL